MKIMGRIRRLSVGEKFPNECIHYQVKDNPKDGDICLIVENNMDGAIEYHIYKKKFDAMFLWLRIRNPYCVVQYFEQDANDTL